MLSTTLSRDDAFQALDDDWKLLCRRHRRTDIILGRWSDRESVFAGLSSLGQVVPPRHRRGDQTATCEALARLYIGGDDLAGRTLLQLLVPGMVVLAAKWRSTFGAGAASWEVLTRSMEQIGKLRDGGRRSRISVWVLKSVYRGLLREVQPTVAVTPRNEDDPPLDDDIRLSTPSAEEVACSDLTVRSALVDAVEQRVIPAHAAPAVWLTLNGLPTRVVADETWHHPASVSRYHTRFAAHVHRQLSEEVAS